MFVRSHRMRLLIEKIYQLNPSRQWLEAESGEVSFRRLYKMTYKEWPEETVLRLRLWWVETQLIETKKPVKELSDKVNVTESQLRAEFERKHGPGMSPEIFRSEEVRRILKKLVLFERDNLAEVEEAYENSRLSLTKFILRWERGGRIKNKKKL